MSLIEKACSDGGREGNCRRGECCSVLDRALNYCQEDGQEMSEKGVRQKLMFFVIQNLFFCQLVAYFSKPKFSSKL